MIQIIICVLFAFILGAALTMCLMKYKHTCQSITKGGAPTAFYTSNQKMSTTVLSNPSNPIFVISNESKRYNSHIEFYAFRPHINGIPMFKCGVEAANKNPGDMECEYNARVGKTCAKIAHYYTNFYVRAPCSGINMGVLLTVAEQCGHAMIAILLHTLTQFITTNISQLYPIIILCLSHDHLSSMYSISNSGSECYTYVVPNSNSTAILCDLFTDDAAPEFIIALSTIMTNAMMQRFISNFNDDWDFGSSVNDNDAPEYLNMISKTMEEFNTAICNFIDSNYPMVNELLNSIVAAKTEPLAGIKPRSIEDMLEIISKMSGGNDTKRKVAITSSWNQHLSGGENIDIVYSNGALLFMKDIINANILNKSTVIMILTCAIFNIECPLNINEIKPTMQTILHQGMENRNSCAGLYNQFILRDTVESIIELWNAFAQGTNVNNIDELIAYAAICIHSVNMHVSNVQDIKSVACHISAGVNNHASLENVKDPCATASEILDFLRLISYILESFEVYMANTENINNLFIQLLVNHQELIYIFIDEILDWYIDSQNASYIVGQLMVVEEYREYITREFAEHLCDLIDLYKRISPYETGETYSMILSTCAQILQQNMN